MIRRFGKKSFSVYFKSLTGTPTFLIEKLKAADFDARDFTDKEIFADGRVLSDYKTDDTNPIPLFYQTGYLTIKDVKALGPGLERYRLGYPNEEVKYGFINSLALSFLHQDNNSKGMPGLMRLTVEK